MKKIFLCMLIFSVALFADAGDKKVTLLGNIKPHINKKLSPKQLEKDITPTQYTLYNPWEKKTDTYEGILLNDFIKFYGNEGLKALHLIALDDYKVTISKELMNTERILLVTKINGEYQPIKQKGPMRIVFLDFDKTNPKYEESLPLWLWMISKIEFE